MTQIIHIVGEQGTGKTSLAMVLAAGFFNQRLTCVVLTDFDAHELYGNDVRNMRNAHPSVDFLVVESSLTGGVNVCKGDRVIVTDNDVAGKDQLAAALVPSAEGVSGLVLPVYLDQPYTAAPTLALLALDRLCMGPA